MSVKTQGATRWVRPADYRGVRLPTPSRGKTVPGTPAHPPTPGRPGVPGRIPRPADLPGHMPGRPPMPTPAKPAVPAGGKLAPMRNYPLPKPGSGIPAGRFLGGALGGIGAGIAIIEYLLPNPKWIPPMGPWVRCGGPVGPDRAYMYTKQDYGKCSNVGLTGQSVSNAWLWGTEVIRPTSTRFMRLSRNNPPGAGGGYFIQEYWTRKAGTYDPEPVPAGPRPPGYNPELGVHPTVQRVLPSAKPNPMPDPHADPAGEGKADTGYAGRTIGGSGTPGGKPVRPTKPEPRQPPKKNERQRKAMSRSKQLMVAFFKALDDVSEAAEVVDAMYDALPPKVKKKWACDGFMPGRHPLIDTAGQYGLDRADCKASALYHNFHNLDVEAAVENIIKNHLSDKIVGAMHRVLPRNTGNAMEESEIALNKLISDFMDDLVDF